MVDIPDRYWIVDSNPTQRWSLNLGDYVDTTNGDYIAWLTSGTEDNPHIALEIVEADLLNYIERYQSSIAFIHEVAENVNLNTNIVLANPLSRTLLVTPDMDGRKLELPQMNLPISLPISTPVIIVNASAFSIDLRSHGDIALVTIGPGTVATLVRQSSTLADHQGNFSSISFALTETSLWTVSKLPVSTDQALVEDSDLLIPTQKAVKAYVDRLGINKVSTANYTLVLADAGGTVEYASATPTTLVIPPDVFPLETYINLTQMDTGAIAITAGVGVTIHSRVGTTTAGLYAMATMYQSSANVWVIGGDLL